MRSFNFDSDSTVYTQVAADLRGVAEWKESKKGDVKADLWLVDGRKKGAIPYAVLGQNRSPQLVNYYRGSGALTLKSSMVRTLRTYFRLYKSAHTHTHICTHINMCICRYIHTHTYVRT